MPDDKLILAVEVMALLHSFLAIPPALVKLRSVGHAQLVTVTEIDAACV